MTVNDFFQQLRKYFSEDFDKQFSYVLFLFEL